MKEGAEGGGGVVTSGGGQGTEGAGCGSGHHQAGRGGRKRGQSRATALLSPVPVVVAKGGGRSEMIVAPPPQEPVITIIDANLITHVGGLFFVAVLKHGHEIDKMNVSK
jgi:hypothetical protein